MSNARLEICTGLVLTIGVALLPLSTWGSRLGLLGPLASIETLWWVAVAVVILYVSLVERRPLSSVGFRRFGAASLVSGVAASILLVLGIVAIYTVVFPLLHLRANSGEMEKLLATPFWYWFAMVTRTAVAEELLFRGYPIERLQELTHSRAIAALVSWAAFTYAHLAGWGAAQLIVAGFGGIVLTVLFVWRRNLWVNIIAHWIGDGAGFLLSK
jgi:membrane protease YdiL (CAAX protease family)